MAGRGIERTGSFGRQNEQLPRTRLAGWSDNRRLFEHDVSVRAADAEGADARPTRNPAPFPIAQRVVHVERAVGDRKSTRLNSSHLVISYAVFCLKKKN